MITLVLQLMLPGKKMKNGFGRRKKYLRKLKMKVKPNLTK